MKKLLPLLLFLSLALTAYPSEVIVSFDEENISVLNEELRQIRSDIFADIALTGDVTGLGNTSIVLTISVGVVGADELENTAVTPASYTNTSLTVDADGRITAASNGVGISQGGLNTATGEVSVTKSADASGDISGNLVLPGGEYGFYPRTKTTSSGDLVTARVSSSMDSAMGGATGSPTFAFRDPGSNPNESYVTRIHLALAFSDSAPGITMTFFAKQRYITASGHDHWIFLLVDKITGERIASYQAPDHPSANQGGATEIDIPHPFGSYDPTKHEIVIVDNTDLPAMKQRVTRKKSLLTVINEDYIIDNTRRPIWTPREIIQIDEYGDIEGEIIKTLKTPEWAKIMIGSKEVTLKRRMVDKLPNNILFKRMKLKEDL